MTSRWLRCLDAATGELLWEAPFTGSPSWSRAQPPVIHKNLAIYMFGTGKYVPKGSGIFVMRMNQAKQLPTRTEGSISWLYSHDNPFYPPDQRAVVRAWDLDSGKVAWTRRVRGLRRRRRRRRAVPDGRHALLFLLLRVRRPGPPGAPSARGLTAALDPATGEVKWLTTKHSVTAGCAISAADGRLYLGGYNQPSVETEAATCGASMPATAALLWQSEPLTKAINVVTVAPTGIFAFAYGGDSYLLDKQTGKILVRFNYGYACTRFSLSSPYLLGSNMDLLDLSAGRRSSRPARRWTPGSASGRPSPTAACFTHLTPTGSRRARSAQRASQAQRRARARRARDKSPLPLGEGQGEGAGAMPTLVVGMLEHQHGGAGVGMAPARRCQSANNPKCSQ